MLGVLPEEEDLGLMILQWVLLELHLEVVESLVLEKEEIEAFR